MRVIDIIKQHLIDNGFDGLCNPGIECGCDLDDFQPCGEDFSQCIPAYRDPATSFLHASKEHFLPELNNENNKTV